MPPHGGARKLPFAGLYFTEKEPRSALLATYRPHQGLALRGRLRITPESSRVIPAFRRAIASDVVLKPPAHRTRPADRAAGALVCPLVQARPSATVKACHQPQCAA